METKLKQISYPVNWNGYKTEQLELHIFADVHHKKYPCKVCKEPGCILLTELFEQIINTSNQNQTYCDVFVEASIQEFEVDYTRKDKSYLIDMYQILKKTKDTKYVHIHTVDTRKLKIFHAYDPFDILYMEMRDVYIAWNVDIQMIEEIKKTDAFLKGDVEKILKVTKELEEDINQTISLLIFDISQLINGLLEFIGQSDVVKVLENIIPVFMKYKKTEEKRKYTKYVKTIDSLIERFTKLIELYKQDRMSLYYKALTELSMKNLDIAKYIDSYIRILIKERLDIFQTQYQIHKNNINELYEYFVELLIMIPSIIMDGYTLAKMFMSFQSGQKQILLYYGGYLHTENIRNFWNELSKIYPIQVIGRSGPQENVGLLEASQCLENPKFEFIFSPWLGPTNPSSPKKSKKFGLKSEYLE
jgi:hypothetical protein